MDPIYEGYGDVGMIEFDIELIDRSFADERDPFPQFFLDQLDQGEDDLSCHLIFVLAVA